jgi:hypothetical protein
MKFVFFIFAGIVLFVKSHAQIQINEASNANESSLPNSPAEYWDWIELLNPSSAAVDLSGYYLTDNINNLTKWNFPQQNLAANEFLVVMASGLDSTEVGSDLHTNFALDNDGEDIFLTDGVVVIQSVTLPNTELNHSSGLSNDQLGAWWIFGSPTPGESNSTSQGYTGYASSPAILATSGFYPGPFLAEIDVPAGTQVHYTFDGSEPNLSDPLYEGPVIVAQNLSVRAKAFANDLLPSISVSRTYFINEDFTLPVLNILADSTTLFDETDGIYMLGNNAESSFPYYGANFWEPTQIPIYAEYFDADGNLVFGQRAGGMIEGGWSRGNPKKSFRIMLDHDAYGDGRQNLVLMPSKPNINQFRSFVARNGGNGWNSVLFRDAFEQRFAKELHVEYNGYHPMVLMINGEYWGVYEFRERQDKHYVASNTGVDDDEMDFIRFNDDVHNVPYLKVLEGSGEGFYQLYDYCVATFMDEPQVFGQLDSMLDLPNYMDYFITQTLFANNDWIGGWTNNIKMWRPNNPVGKWRYILWDMDFGLCFFNGSWQNKITETRNPPAANEHAFIFDQMLYNQTFRFNFINRYADLLNTTFKAEPFYESLMDMKNQVYPEMERDFNRWGNNNVDNWENQVNDLMTCFSERRTNTPAHIIEEFNLTDSLHIVLDVYPPDAGAIQISSIIAPQYPWDGLYFQDVVVPFDAIAGGGFTFSHWESSFPLANIEMPQQNLLLPGNCTLTAVFEAIDNTSVNESTTSSFRIIPNPTNDIFNISAAFPWQKVMVYNSIGQRVREFSFSEEKTLSGLSDGIYWLAVSNQGEISKYLKIIKQ